MIKALLFSSILATSFAVGHVETADACGIKMGASSGVKARKARASGNPSNILILGDRDSALAKKLKSARHTTEYASSASSAKRAKYDLVIADESQYDDAVERFKTAQILKKKSSSSKSTARAAETMLARRSVGRTPNVLPTAVATARTPKEFGRERGDIRTPIEADTDTPVAAPATRVSPAVSPTPEPRVASITKPSPAEPEIAPKAERDAAKAERDAAKAERKAERDAAKAERKAARDAAKAERKVATAETTVGRTGAWTRNLRFGNNMTTLSAASTKRLRNNANWMQANPDAQIVIEGHTDSVGDEAYNLDLSERRANAARDLLIGFGVDSSRISIEAKGELEPATEPSTSAKNRRVVLIKK